MLCGNHGVKIVKELYLPNKIRKIMKANYTHVSMLLDGSGSMDRIKSDIIGGFNSFVEQQKAVPGEMTLSLAQFNVEYKIIYDFVSIKDVIPLTDKAYIPMDGTALLDSAAKLIADTGTKIAKLPEHERPERVMVVILTDGKENSSREYTKPKLAEMIKHQEEKYNWQFVYIGANQDGFEEGASMGMRGMNFQATAGGTQTLYASLGANVAKNRGATRGTNINLTQEDIDAEEKK
jgi:hypothetical protein